VAIEVASLDSLASEVTDEAASQGVLAPDLSPSGPDRTGHDDDPIDVQFVDTDDLGTDLAGTDLAGTDLAGSDLVSTDLAGSDLASTEDGRAAGQGTWSDTDTTWADDDAADEALSAGLIVDPPPDDVDGGEPTMAVPVIDTGTFADDGADEDLDVLPVRTTMRDLAPIAGGESSDADDGTSDPFLDELRRVTSEDEDDEALSKFLNDAESEADDAKGGWFGRRK